MLLPKKYWFILGRETMLSLAEICSLAGITDVTWQRPNRLTATLAIDPALFMARLGGTIKIAEEIGNNLSRTELAELCQNILKEKTGKIIFGLSFYPGEIGQPILNRGDLETLGKELKRSLKAGGQSVRYVQNRETVLSSATVFHNDLVERGVEFLIAPTGKTFSLAKTTALQPFEEFGERDFGRPGFDSVSGMLPLKLALMMVNLAGAKLDDTLLDPFCGSGTILMEAALQGYTDIIGADSSEQAITDSQKNLAWLQEKFSLPNVPAKTMVSDVRTISNVVTPRSIAAIVTEPYLGPPQKGRETPDQLHTIGNELITLYAEAFREFKKILQLNGVVIFVIPRFKQANGWLTLSDRLLPELTRLGFAPERLLPESLRREQFLLYHRPDQHVGREIWKFALQR